MMEACGKITAIVIIVFLADNVPSTDGGLTNRNENHRLCDNAAVNENDSYVNADQCTNPDLVRTSIGDEPKCCAKDYHYVKEKCACVKCLSHLTNCCPSTFNICRVDLRTSSCETISAKCVIYIPPQVVASKPDNSTMVKKRKVIKQKEKEKEEEEEEEGEEGEEKRENNTAKAILPKVSSKNNETNYQPDKENNDDSDKQNKTGTSKTENTTNANVSTDVITQTSGTNAKHESWLLVVTVVYVLLI